VSKYTIVNLETDRALSWATTLVAANRSAQQFSTVPRIGILCAQRVVEEYRFGVLVAKPKSEVPQPLVVKSKPDEVSPLPEVPKPLVIRGTVDLVSKPKIVIRRRRDKEDDEDDDT
jgi:hypothetical protein